MICVQVRVQLAAYHEGGLRPSQRHAVAVHVASCPACRAELDTYDEGDRALRRFVAETPSTSIYDNVLQRLAEENTARSQRKAHLVRSMGSWLNVAGTL